MIIDSSYFLTKSVFIPNAVVQPSIGDNTPTAITDLNSYIDLKEYELLLNALGKDQYTELIAQLNPNGTWKDDALQKWKDLVDGKGTWKGLRFTIGSTKQSLIAYYVYFYYLSDDWSQYGTTGIQVAETANSTQILPNENMAKAWNTFVKMYGGYDNSLNTPTFFYNWNGLGMRWGGALVNGNEVTLYDFLTENNDVYDTSFFQQRTPVNTFGL